MPLSAIYTTKDPAVRIRRVPSGLPGFTRSFHPDMVPGASEHRTARTCRVAAKLASSTDQSSTPWKRAF